MDNEEDDGSVSILRVKVAELECKLIDDKQRYSLLQTELELSKLVAEQMVEKYERECASLKDMVRRLKEDQSTLRGREIRDQESIKNLLDKIERNEREFTQKLAELKLQNWELECVIRKSQYEARAWMKKYEGAKEKEVKVNGAKGKEHGEGLERRILKLVRENFHVAEKEKEKGGAGESCIGPASDGEAPRELGSGGARDAPVEDAQTPTAPPAENTQEKSDESYTPKKKSKLSNSGCSTAMYSGSAGRDSVSDKEARAYLKRNAKNGREYTGRIASSEQRLRAAENAETFKSNLKACNPLFIRVMVRSHVSSCFWLALPPKFCKEHLPINEVEMLLEDEKGLEHKAKYIGNRNALSGGWRGFALYQKLELGDVLIFELVEPTRFKVYIIKAIPNEPSGDFL